jgi:hypothetical protein
VPYACWTMACIFGAAASGIVVVVVITCSCSP